MLDASIGSLHYLDAGSWLECETDWRDSDDANFSDRADRLPFKCYAKSDGTRRIYPRRDVPAEYIEFGLMQYWRTAGGGSWRTLPAGVKNRSSDRLSYDSADVAVAYIATPDQSFIEAVLKTASAPARVRWPVTLAGLTLEMATGLLTSTAEGIAVGAMQMPVATDAARVQRAVTVSYAGGYLEWQLDTAGLTFPVTVR